MKTLLCENAKGFFCVTKKAFFYQKDTKSTKKSPPPPKGGEMQVPNYLEEIR